MRDLGLTPRESDSGKRVIGGGPYPASHVINYTPARPAPPMVNLRGEDSRSSLRATLRGRRMSDIDRASQEMGEHDSETPRAVNAYKPGLVSSDVSPLISPQRHSAGIQHGRRNVGMSPLVPPPPSPCTATPVSKPRGAQSAMREYGPTNNMLRRRSVDGGVRIAGGPASRVGVDLEPEVRSAASTLPPLYERYYSS